MKIQFGRKQCINNITILYTSHKQPASMLILV